MLRPLGRKVSGLDGRRVRKDLIRACICSFIRCGWVRVVFVGFVNRAKIAKWTTAGQAIIIYRILEPYLPHHPTKSYANEGPRQPHPPNLNTATTTPSFHLSWTIEGEERCVKSGATTMINYHRRNIVEICGWQSVVVCGSVRQCAASLDGDADSCPGGSSRRIDGRWLRNKRGDGFGCCLAYTTKYIYHPCFRSDVN